MAFFRFFGTRQPQPGSMSLAFQMPTTLPVIETDGPGRSVSWSWKPRQPPQVYQTKTAPSAGLGGLISNGIIFQPLVEDSSGFPKP